jgi:hypothetical protein
MTDISEVRAASIIARYRENMKSHLRAIGLHKEIVKKIIFLSGVVIGNETLESKQAS